MTLRIQKIISDGTTENTKILLDNGERLAGVLAFHIHGRGKNQLIDMDILLRPGVEIEIENVDAFVTKVREKEEDHEQEIDGS